MAVITFPLVGALIVKGTETPVRLMTCIFQVSYNVTPYREASARDPRPRAAGVRTKRKPERLVLELEDPYPGQSPT